MGLLQVPKAPSPGSKGQICPPYYTFGPRSLGPEQKTAISSRRLTRISQMLAAPCERRDAHTQQHLQRWRMGDIWLDREPGEREMVPRLRALAAAAALMLAVSDGETAFAEKSGGILKIGQFDSPAGMSILEESSNTAEGPHDGGVQQSRALRPARAAE